MKRSALLLTLVITLGISSASKADTNTQQMTIASANGGSEILFSWDFGGNILAPSFAKAGVSTTFNAVGLTTTFVNSGYFSGGTNFSVSGAGTFTNITTAHSSKISSVYFNNLGGGTGQVFLQLVNPFVVSLNDVLQYTPGTDAYILNAPYAAFIPGVYTMNNPLTSPSLAETLTIGAVPEPSTYALFGLGLVGLVTAFRRKTKFNFILAAAAFLLASVNDGRADTFGSGGNTFVIDFTTIGNPGNAADTNDHGAVGYTYNIGTYEVSRDMITTANAASSASSMALSIPLADMTSYGGNVGTHPATGVSWNEAARFVNWLNTSSGFSAAYNFTYQPGAGGYSANANLVVWTSGDVGYDASNPYRNSNAHYFLPTLDEWYKAAYYNAGSSNYNGYPTGSGAPTAVASGTAANSAVYNQALAVGPVAITNAGGLSPYGTMGQGGNAWEWNESPYTPGDFTAGSSRGLRGGSWSSSASNLQSSSSSLDDPTYGDASVGFRVASVPEPSTYALFGLGGLALVMAYRRRVI